MAQNVPFTREEESLELGTLELSPLQAALEWFNVSRQAMRCTPATMEFYRYSAGAFVKWLEAKGVNDPKAITVAHVREWLAEANKRGLKDTSVLARARGVRTFLKSLYTDEVIPQPITFTMPRVEHRRLLCLDRDQLRQILACDHSKRVRAIVYVLTDSGVRASELCGLNWQDLDKQTGALAVHLGKGRKDRTAVIGPKSMRALLAYRRTFKRPPYPDSPLIRSVTGGRMTAQGLSRVMRRLSKRSKVKVTCHALRRTFAVQSLRSGMDVLSLQRLMGHADLSMTSHYVQMIDSDLVAAHQRHGLDAWL